ncbi:MAG: NAD(P)/FAD-dependent oxidoreductase [Alphaproteobacteria bacterium]
MAQVGVVGAGIAGLACAAVLREAGHQVALFDKGRGPGGRMSTRRVVGGMRFDHGAQYFTVHTPEFAEQVAVWEAAGVAAPWPGRFLEVLDPADDAPQSDIRWVGMPAMNVIVRHEAQLYGARFTIRISRLSKRGKGWHLHSEQGARHGPYDAVALALPAPQAAGLLEGVSDELHARVREVVMAPCWAVMMALSEPLELPFDGLKLSGDPLIWAARDSAKPGRPEGGPECWVLQAGPDWSRVHLEDDAAYVTANLIDAFARIVPGQSFHIARAGAHRWRHARVEVPAGEPALFDADAAVGMCGDWCIGPRVEAAWLSGRELGMKLVAALGG